MKIGLVLGSGGFVGGAWLTGALEALETQGAVLPRHFDTVVGTSAGAMIAALTSSGVHPSAVPDIFAGRAPRDGTAIIARPDGARLRLQRGFPNPLPSSARVAFNALRHRRTPVGVALAAMMPRGFISTEPLREIVRQVVPAGWSAHPGLWLVACDLTTGKRVVFGKPGSPAADLAEAVAASCAIPGFYCPVEIAGHRYVDGGACSPSNLDVVRDAGLDLVICFNPTSSLHRAANWSLSDRIGAAYRAASSAQLDREVGKLRRAGTEVLTVQPTVEDLAVMGVNLMAADNLVAISEQARRTVAQQLAAPRADDFMKALRARTDLATPAARRTGHPLTPAPARAAAMARASSAA